MKKKAIESLVKENRELFKSGILYFFCIIFIVIIAKKILEYPVMIAYKYNIKLTGEEYINMFVNYKYIFMTTLIIAIGAIPFVKLINRIKKISKDGGEFYPDEKQNTNNIVKANGNQISGREVQDILTSNDDKIFNEPQEKAIYESAKIKQDNNTVLLKCQNIKANMKPLTQLVTRELYNHNKEEITIDITKDHVMTVGKHKGKKWEDKNKEIAKNIIAFLKNNDIIESDDMEDGKYYFTLLGRAFMNYFSSGII